MHHYSSFKQEDRIRTSSCFSTENSENCEITSSSSNEELQTLKK